MPLRTRRSSTRRAPGRLWGRWGSIAAHCSLESQNSPAIFQTPPFREFESQQIITIQSTNWVLSLGRRLVQPGAEPRTAAAWSKYLNRYLNTHVTDAPDLVLYSLRHAFRQMLRASNIGDELANKVFGHETGTVG